MYGEYDGGAFVGPVVPGTSDYDEVYGTSSGSGSITDNVSSVVGSILGAWSTVEAAKINARLGDTAGQQSAGLNETSQRSNTDAASASLTIGGKQVSMLTVAAVAAVGLLGLVAAKKLL